MCALEAHIMAIEHGKRGFLVNHKPFLYLGIGLNLNEQLDDEYVVHFMKVTMCAFCGGKFPPTWECRLATYMHMYHSWCVVAHFSISMKCLVKGCHQEMHLDWWKGFKIIKPNEKSDDPCA